jgi:hypothetical protein
VVDSFVKQLGCCRAICHHLFADKPPILPAGASRAVRRHGHLATAVTHPEFTVSRPPSCKCKVAIYPVYIVRFFKEIFFILMNDNIIYELVFRLHWRSYSSAWLVVGSLKLLYFIVSCELDRLCISQLCRDRLWYLKILVIKCLLSKKKSNFSWIHGFTSAILQVQRGIIYPLYCMFSLRTTRKKKSELFFLWKSLHITIRTYRQPEERQALWQKSSEPPSESRNIQVAAVKLIIRP